MEKLTTINADELIFSDNPGDDRINTKLILDDYDWMNYKLQTAFHTEKLGVLSIEIEYFGATTSRMTVKQRKTKNRIYIHSIDFPTDIFQEYIIKFMKSHIDTWAGTLAFNGEDIALEFYNAIINAGKYAEED